MEEKSRGNGVFFGCVTPGKESCALHGPGTIIPTRLSMPAPKKNCRSIHAFPHATQPPKTSVSSALFLRSLRVSGFLVLIFSRGIPGAVRPRPTRFMSKWHIGRLSFILFVCPAQTNFPTRSAIVHAQAHVST